MAVGTKGTVSHLLPFHVHVIYMCVSSLVVAEKTRKERGSERWEWMLVVLGTVLLLLPFRVYMLERSLVSQVEVGKTR